MNNNTAIGILSALFILIGSWVLSLTNFCGGSAETPANFSFTDGAFKSKSVDAFSFEKDGIFATIPAVTNGELKKIAAHFKSNENRTLSLVGSYYASEKYTGETDLGKERAEAIKAKLVKYGTPADRIITSGKELTGVLEGKRLYNAVAFKGNEKADEAVVETPGEIEFSPSGLHTVYFDSGNSELEMTIELRKYLDQAMEYLNRNSGAVLLVNGYTDSEESSNKEKLSRDRARRIRTFLYENGIKKNQVMIQGLGETNPNESNDTDEGKALNRRLEISIK
ncbi:MAG: OmpA family protein [Saprospiraceae bacterium]